MEKQLNSDIEVEVIFRGVPLEMLPDFRFDFYTELHKDKTYTCSKEGGKRINCTTEGCEAGPIVNTVVKCMIEKHEFLPGRLCVLAHIKWLEPDYADWVRNDIYRHKLNLIVKP